MTGEKRKNREMQKNETVEDINEYIELLKGLTRDEKNQVKGVMIGMQMMREKTAALSA